MKAAAICALGVVFAVSNFAVASTLKCPSKKHKLEFESLSLYDGDPANNVDLAPDNADSPMPHKWTLNKTLSPRLVCNYGPKGAKLYTKTIKGTPSLCETVKSLKGSGKYDSIACK